jgi:hypothetical protein
MKLRKHDYIVWGIILLTGMASWYTNHYRVIYGFFTSDGWIFWDGFFYTLFYAFIVGYVVAKVISFGNDRKYYRHYKRRR